MKSSSSKLDKQFLECVNDNYLIQHVLEPTRKENILDLVLTTRESDICTLSNSAPLGNSDHDVVKFTFNCSTEYQPEKTRYDINKGDYEKMRNIVSCKFNDFEFNLESPIEDDWNLFKNVLLKAQEETIPKINIGKSKTKNKYIDLLTKRKDYQHKIWKWRETNLGWRNQLTRNAKEKYKLINGKLSSNIVNKERNYELRIAKNPNSKPFNAFINKKLKLKTNVGPLEENDTIYFGNEEIAKILNEQFASVYTAENTESIPDINIDLPESIESLTDIEITNEIVYNYLKTLDVYKSTGPDEILSKTLNETKNEICEILTFIIKKSLSTSEIPSDWKTAHIAPILKKHPREDKNNYRPISLTSISAKICEKFVRQSIMEHMIRYDLFTNEQHGGLSKRSRVTQLLECLDDWSQNLDNNIQTDIIYIDFSKAFDRVPHQRLLNKLKAYKIDGKILDWIKNFLSDRKQRVKIKDFLSDPESVTSGVPQGTVLGPVLFLIYINDLPRNLSSSSKIFVDDMKYYQKINCTADCISVQNDCNTTYQWQDVWQLPLNQSKCEILSIGKKIDYNYSFGTVEIPKCDQVKDLGVVITKNLSPSQHCTDISKKAQKLLYMIHWSFKYLDNETRLHLYKSRVRSILESACPVWSPYLQKDIDCLESIQRRATRFNDITHLSYTERLKKLNLYTLIYRRMRYDMIQLWKIIEDEKLLSKLNLVFETSTRTRGHSKKLKQQPCNKNLLIRRNAFTVRIVPIWNRLSDNCVSKLTLETFKSVLDKELPTIIDPFETDFNSPIFPHHVRRFLN